MPGGRLSTGKCKADRTEREAASEGPGGSAGGEEGPPRLAVAGWETPAEKTPQGFLARFLRSGKLGVCAVTLMSKSRGLGGRGVTGG